MMNITPVRFAGINNIFVSQQPRVKQACLNGDVFVRSCLSDSKSNNANETFIDWAKRTDYLNTGFPQTFFTENNIVGSGFNHTVYAIPETDKYVLRGPNDQLVKMISKMFDYSKTTITDIEDKNLKINIGQPVAQITATTNSGIKTHFEVLKKQKGTPLGVPPYGALINDDGYLKPGVEPYEAESRKIQYRDSLEKVANMPIEAYSTLISELQEAYKSGYVFDHLNSNNLLVDEKNERFNIIDMEKIDLSRFDNKVKYGNVLYALTNYCYYKANAMGNNQNQEALDNTIKIIQKFMMAMKKAGVKFDKNNTSYEFDELLRSEPMKMLNYPDANIWSYFENNQVA